MENDNLVFIASISKPHHAEGQMLAYSLCEGAPDERSDLLVFLDSLNNNQLAAISLISPCILFACLSNPILFLSGFVPAFLVSFLLINR